MCGICGMILPEGGNVDPALLKKMNRLMSHRGPDGEGYHIDGCVGLGHRRLSIIDLKGGDQPIFNEDGSVAVVYNGEIYNYQAITKELEQKGHRFSTRSDTEILVHLYEEYGIEMLSRLRGMFAFALWDGRKRELFLVRDRFGIKPLYYQESAGVFRFASEIKPILACGAPMEVNPLGVHLFLQTRFAHSDESIFKGIHRLAEGTYLHFKGGSRRLVRYYQPPQVAGRRDGRDYDGMFAEALREAVRLRMIADVPVGAYLSGGVDSTVVVSEMADLAQGHPVETFCVDFAQGYTEAAMAQRAADKFGCKHHTVILDVEQLLELPAVVNCLEEPVGDGIVVAVYFLSRATRSAGVKTVVTGDGADETLGGYQYLRAILEAARWGKRLPGFLFSPLGSRLALLAPPILLQKISDLPFDAARDVQRRFSRLLDAAPRRDLQEMYDLLTAMFYPEELREIYTDDFWGLIKGQGTESFAGAPSGRTKEDAVLSLQYRKWLPANINLKQDRLCMAHSVENRVPFLDHKFVELACSLPIQRKLWGRRNKIILRDFAHKKGLELGGAPGRKVPFYLPLEHYMADGRLWEMIEDNLNPARLKSRNILRPQFVASIKEKARRSDFMAAKKLLALVILELWHRMFVDGEQIGSYA